MAGSPLGAAGGRVLAAARELRGFASAAALSPFCVTPLTDAVLLRLLRTGQPRSAPLHTPVVLLHGLGSNPSVWLPLRARLDAAGFRTVRSSVYAPSVGGVSRIAAGLVRDCRAAMAEAGVERVHVVGHSLGGLALRCAVARHGLGDHLGLGLTIAAPHGGSPLAWLGCGALAADLRPGSALLTALDRVPVLPGRWVCYWSDGDLVVPPRSALWSPPGGEVVTVAVPGEAHMSLLRSRAVLDDAVARLVQVEAEHGRAVPAGPRARAA